MKKNAIFAVIFATGIIGSLVLYNKTKLDIQEPVRILVPTGSTYTSLTDSLKVHHCINRPHLFLRLSQLRGLTHHVQPGSYLIQPHTDLIQLVQKFYSGRQDPIRITINRHRTKRELCDFLSSRLELSADSLLYMMNNDSIATSYGENCQTIIGMFLQDTYELYWSISPNDLLDRMHKESKRFWSTRQGLLTRMGLTQQQVITLASIIDEETNVDDEKPDIASVYLNRYRMGMPLQADPTVKYAIGDFSIRRIKGNMLKRESPYNTYSHAGLPPGPICIPSKKSIDAVLINKKTDYLFFCAKEDFSGHHNFSSTHEEHLNNAKKFHKALNKRGVK